MASLHGLVRVAQQPQGLGGIGEAGHAGILAIDEDMGTVLLAIVESNPLLQMRLSRGELSQIVQGIPKRIVRLQEERGVVGPLGQAEELLAQLPCRLYLPS